MLVWITGIHFGKLVYYMTTLIALHINLALMINFNFKPNGKCIYDRCSYTMKTS